MAVEQFPKWQLRDKIICEFSRKKFGEAKMADFNESKDNPLHKDFGVLSNTLYILKKEKQYRPSAIWYKLLGIVCGSVLSYFWGIFGKYVIALIFKRHIHFLYNVYGFIKISLINRGE